MKVPHWHAYLLSPTHTSSSGTLPLLSSDSTSGTSHLSLNMSHKWNFWLIFLSRHTYSASSSHCSHEYKASFASSASKSRALRSCYTDKQCYLEVPGKKYTTSRNELVGFITSSARGWSVQSMEHQQASSAFACKSYSVTVRKPTYADDSKNSQFQASEMGLDSQRPKDHYL